MPDIYKDALKVLDYILNNPSGTAREYTFADIERNKIVLDYLVIQGALKRVGDYSVRIDTKFMDVYRTVDSHLLQKNQTKLFEKQTEFNRIVAITGSIIAVVVIINFLDQAFTINYFKFPDWLVYSITTIAIFVIGYLVTFIRKNLQE